MIILIGIILFVVLLVYSVFIRTIVCHPISSIVYGCYDVYKWFKYKLYDVYNAGKLDCYCAHFGGGKTLSIVKYVCHLYRRYHNKKVFDLSLGKFVTQKIHIISNVEFTGIPFEKLESLQQIVDQCYHNKRLDAETGCRTCIIVVIDEASSQLNSRQFKSNINADFLNTLITSRHYHMSILYSSQKFKLTDKLLRDVTQRVIQCKKIWRVLIQYEYDADSLEYASDPSMVKPNIRLGHFVKNKDYYAYDTLAVVDKLKKDVDAGNMISDSEILSLRDTSVPNDDSIRRFSRKGLRRFKRRKTG